MNAQTAKNKAEENLRAIEERRKAQDAATLARALVKAMEEKKRISQYVTERAMPEALGEIEKAVGLGKTSVLIRYGFSSYEIADGVRKVLLTLGYSVTPRGVYVEPDSGDRDSGEGKSDGGWTHDIEVCWG